MSSLLDFARPLFRRLPAPARDALRTAAHPRREAMYRADWRAFRDAIDPIVRAIRFDNTRTESEVLIHAAHGFVPSLKEETLHGAMLRAAGARPVFIASRSGGLDRYVRLVPDARLVYWEDFYVDPTPRDEQAARDVLAPVRTIRDLITVERDGIAIGRHVASTFMRARHLGTIDIDANREELAAVVARSLAAARASAALLEQERAPVVLMNERGYTPYGELFDEALRRKRRVVQWLSAHRDDARVFKAYTTDTRAQHVYSLSADTWSQALSMPFTDADKQRLLDEWEARYTSKTWYNYQRLQHLTRPLTREEVVAELGLDPSKSTAVLFPHIFWDATFFYGDGLYDDYQQWFVETVRLANESAGVNWVVKLHPVNVWRLAADGAAGSQYAELVALEQQGIRLAPHVKLLMPDTHISTWSLFAAADYCFTVRGTVGIEMAALGKRVVTAGTGHYSGHGFTIDPSSVDGYAAIVRDPQRLPEMTDDERDRALRFAYWFFERKAYRFDTHRFEYSGAADVVHALNGRARILAPSGEAFLKSATAAAWSRWLVSSTLEDCLT